MGGAGLVPGGWSGMGYPSKAGLLGAAGALWEGLALGCRWRGCPRLSSAAVEGVSLSQVQLPAVPGWGDRGTEAAHTQRASGQGWARRVAGRSPGSLWRCLGLCRGHPLSLQASGVQPSGQIHIIHSAWNLTFRWAGPVSPGCLAEEGERSQRGPTAASPGWAGVSDGEVPSPPQPLAHKGL